MVDIKLIYHRLEEKKGEWVEEVSRCIVNSFQLGDNEDPNEDYTDCTARKTMQDSLQLRFNLVEGMFESITTTMQSITDWSTLLVQLVVRRQGPRLT